SPLPRGRPPDRCFSASRPRRSAGCSATFRNVSRLRGIVGAVRSHPFASDATLAGVLAVLALGDIYTSGNYLTGSRWIYVPAALLMTVPLAWRRIAPLPVIAVVMGALIAQSLALGTTPADRKSTRL